MLKLFVNRNDRVALRWLLGEVVQLGYQEAIRGCEAIVRARALIFGKFWATRIGCNSSRAHFSTGGEISSAQSNS